MPPSTVSTTVEVATRLGDMLGQTAWDAPIGQMLVDRQGKIAWVNPVLCTIFGYRSGELLGEALEQLVPVAMKHSHVELREGFMQQPERRTMGGSTVLFGRHARGHEVPVEVGLSSVVLENEEYAVAYVADVSERYYREKELEIHRRNLEELVEERTEDLRLALRTTEANVQLLNDVLSSLSHEFRNPLSVMVGYGELLTDIPEGEVERRQKYAQDIVRSGSHLVGLVQKATHMSVVSSGKLAADPKPVVTSEILDVAAVRTRRATGSDAFTLVENLEDARRITCDRELMTRVLALLFENSVKYAGATCEITVTVETDQAQARFIVDDNGPGIDPKDRGRVFEPFERLDRTRGDISGIGLGLTLARGYVQAMGGQIALDGAPSGGLRVLVTLPHG